MYKVVFTKSAGKQLEKIPKIYYKAIAKQIDDLELNPYPIGFKKMVGIDNVYRIRIENYRVLYEIQNEILLITVIKVAHRQSVYD